LSASTLHNSKWRQGAVVPHDLLEDGVLRAALRPEDKLILISHDCDIVSTSYEAEPFVEFIVARPLAPEARDGRLSNGKNPRRLQLWVTSGSSRLLLELSIHEKHRMKRQLLETGEPITDCTVRPADIRTLAFWVAKRYARPSFPSAFNDRIKKVADKLEKAMERFGHDVTDTFIAFLGSDGELPGTDPYEIDVRVVIEPEAALDGERESQALKLVAELNKLLGQCQGVNAEVQLVSETDFSLNDLRLSRHWDFDFISTAQENDDHPYMVGR